MNYDRGTGARTWHFPSTPKITSVDGHQEYASYAIDGKSGLLDPVAYVVAYCEYQCGQRNKKRDDDGKWSFGGDKK